MIWLLLGLHLAVIGALAIGGRSLGRFALLLGALPPAVTSIWATIHAGTTSPFVVNQLWVEGLDLGFRFRIDALAALMTLLISGIGTVVFVYAFAYFSPTAKGVPGFAATLLAFSVSMLGLVWADSIWTLFIFWELTSVTSFLLVGHKHEDEDVQAAARRALMITGGGGLALLAGFLLLANNAGTVVISDLSVASGSTGTMAAVLIMVAAATKSAQLPFHVWLPGAMAAPTPVSAYLHSATMVKAGVLLVAVTGPFFADSEIWKWLGLTFGITSMLWGAVGALRHRDGKLILAWGTISQLGLLITLLSLGSAKATFAAISLLFAHALFKAALFLVIGEVDVRVGTRDITRLGGLYRTMPLTFATAVAAGASMAGIPPLLGFAAKEAAIEAVLGLKGMELAIAATAVVGGAVLTVAYTTRFLYGVFGPGPAVDVAPAKIALNGPGLLLAAASVAGFLALGLVNDIVGPAAVELDADAAVYSLLRWPGLTTGLAVSVGVVIVGLGLGLLLRSFTPPTPIPRGADLADDLFDGVLEGARRVTARIQHGSLPVYVATMAATAAAASLPFLGALHADVLVAWDRPLQAVVGAAVVVTAFASARVGSRLGAAVALGAVGVGVSGLFVLHGAPDLLLTQLLVETVVVVGFVVGLGHLSSNFPPVGATWRSIRLGVAGLGGLGVMVALAASATQPTGRPPIDAIADQAVVTGGGQNVVNVILTDIRGLDTLGEVVVIGTVALGILALTRTQREGRQTS